MKASETIDGPLFNAAAAEFELTQGLRALQPIAIAVSGGVNSLTLATLASRALPPAARVSRGIACRPHRGNGAGERACKTAGMGVGGFRCG